MGEASSCRTSEADVNVDLADTAQAMLAILRALEDALRGRATKAGQLGAVDFSVTRGITGVSL